jgi:PadR family transcriptional regulator, regulatory protein AphA
MSIEHAILGLLSWRPMSGYDLKKIFEDASILYWSGNNNEIYRTLVKLHADGQVTRQVEQQESLPARKVYSITTQGQETLKKWVLASPEPPQLRHTFLIQLSWADALSPAELAGLLAKYEDEVQTQYLMACTGPRPSAAALTPNPRTGYLDSAQARTPREALLWQRIQEHERSFYENELNWVRTLRKEMER